MVAGGTVVHGPCSQQRSPGDWRLFQSTAVQLAFWTQSVRQSSTLAVDVDTPPRANVSARTVQLGKQPEV